MPHNLSRERYLPEPLKIRTDWFNPSIAHKALPADFEVQYGSHDLNMT